MALKFKLTKAAFEKLTDDMKAHYTEAEDGKGYVLEVTGLPEPEDAGELKRALERVRADLKEAETERDTLQTAADEAEKNKGKGDKDVERLTRRHDQKIADLQAENKAKIEAHKATITKLMKSNKSLAMATEISTTPSLLAKEIDARMVVDFPDDGDPVLRFLDKDGKPAAADFTLDKLKAEFVANPEYKSIIVGSKAKGGGAPPAGEGRTPLGSTQSDAAGKPVLLTQLDNASFTDRMRAVNEARKSA